MCAILETAKQVYSNVSDNLAKGSKRGEYQKFTSEDKAKIGKYASKNGVRNAARKFKGKNLKESSVRDWRDLYLNELQDRRKMVKLGEEIIIDTLPSKKCGRPLLLGQKLDGYLQQLIVSMRARGTHIGTNVAIAIGREY